jgi:hypothetical protein
MVKNTALFPGGFGFSMVGDESSIVDPGVGIYGNGRKRQKNGPIFKHDFFVVLHEWFVIIKLTQYVINITFFIN